MSAASCDRWTEVWDRAALGEAVSADELAGAREHAASCAACAAESRVYEALGRCLDGDGRALTEPIAAPPTAPASTRRALRRRWAFAAAASLACAAGAAVWFFGGSDRSATVPAEKPVVLALAAGEVDVQGARAAAGTALRPVDELRVGRGRACLSYGWGTTACADADSVLKPISGDEQRGVRLERGTVVCRLDEPLPGARFSVETARGRVTAKGTVFTLQHLPSSEVAVRLHRGVIEIAPIRGEPRELRAPAAVVLGDDVRPVRADDAAWKRDADLIELGRLWSSRELVPFELATNPPGARISVDGFGLGESPLSALLARGEHELLVERAGFAPLRERLSVQGIEPVRRSSELVAIAPESEAAKPQTAPEASSASAAGEARPSAADLLARARSLRSAGRYAEAAAAYRALIATRADSAEARAALVSLGELQLSQLKDPAAALRSFESYLIREGTLTQEARYGRIRALRALGRTAEAERAARDFVQRYPGSAQAKQLEQPGKP